MRYNHFTLYEREKLMQYRSQQKNLSQIAILLGKNKSSISRELKRCNDSEYIASTAQENYDKKRKECKRKYKLSNPEILSYVKDKFINENWSPEQIDFRYKLDNKQTLVGYSTIYRGIYRGEFDKYIDQSGHKSAKRKLRHKGKRRHKKGDNSDKRGKFQIEHNIDERPLEAKEKTEIGHWEADTVLGVKGGKCLTTLTDRKSLFEIAVLTESKTAEAVTEKIISALKGLKCKTITPDRGKEFALYKEIEKALSIIAYFPYPHHPWERGLNENFNGLIREYFPKGFDFATVKEEDIKQVIDKLNNRPRKKLGFLTPNEVFFGRRCT